MHCDDEEIETVIGIFCVQNYLDQSGGIRVGVVDSARIEILQKHKALRDNQILSVASTSVL